tara:strand:- start:322 stop:540 length:219 start_codon:yes stop_codon:yes gene_type:complete
MQYYTLFNSTNGLNEHTENLTLTQANELETELMECFPNEQFEIHPQMNANFDKSEIRNIPRGAADGWEDLHN